MHRLILLSVLFFISATAVAQIDSTETFDYSKFGDAEGVKRYCNQKVTNQTPTRIVSIGYDQQCSFEIPTIPVSAMLPAFQDFSAKNLSVLRAQVNIPIVSTNKVIWQVGANYWGSGFNIENSGTNLFTKTLQSHFLASAGLNSTLFKPLNEKNFLIIQASADVNGIFHTLKDVNKNALTWSGSFVYGWKISEKNMIGTGIARTYRAGRILHVPILLWNKTFNENWGMELLLPARGHLRYNFSTSSMLQVGFELEGNQFWMSLANSPKGELYLQRGELKPRLMWDKKLAGFIWFNAQAGLRYNWRFDGMNQYNGSKDNQRYFMSKLGNPLYFSFSLNFVSP